MIRTINQVKATWNLVGYFDDDYPQGANNYYKNVIGNLKALNNYPKKLAVGLAIASPKILENLTQKITNRKIYFPNDRHIVVFMQSGKKIEE